MAKVKRKTRPEDSQAGRDRASGAPRTTTQRKPSRWGWWLLGLLLVVTATVAAAPTVICRTPLRGSVLALATADLHGTLEVGDLSIGWFSPLSATDLRLLDPAGNVVLSLPSVTGDTGLARLLTSGGQLGSIKLDHPQANIVVRDDGSNVEDLFTAYTKPNDKPTSAASVDLTLEIVAAKVQLTEPATQRSWTIEPFNLKLHTPRNAAETLEVSLAGAIASATSAQTNTPAPTEAVTFALQLASQEVATGATTTKIGSLALQAQGFPLELTRAFVRRAMPGSELAGRFYSDLRCQWGLDTTGRVRRLAEGQLALREFVVAGPWSGGEQLRLAAVDMPCQIAWEGDQLNIRQWTINSDVGQLTCQATIPGADRLLEPQDYRCLLAAIGRGTSELTGQINVARLALLLPQTMRIRNDVQVVSGTVNLQLAGRPDADGSVWQGRLDASRLVAQHAGREVSWDQPFTVTAVGREKQRALLVDRLQCLSDFLKVEGAGSADAFQWNGTFDLNRLATELSKFVDMQGVQLAGQGTTQGGWQRAGDGAFQANGQMQLNRFELSAAGLSPWTEEQLNLTANAAGTMDDQNQLRSVQSAQATLLSAGDQLTATLKSPMTNPGPQAVWPLDLQVRGELASWLRRLTPVVGTLPGWEATGKTEWTTTASYAQAGVEIERSELTIQPLHVRGHGVFIDEPVAKVRAAGRWSAAAATVEVREAVVETSAIVAQMRDGKLALSHAAAAQNNAQLQIDGDLSRMVAWLHDPVQPATLDLTGTLRSVGRLGHQAGSTTADLETSIDNLLFTPRGGRQWREPTVKLTVNGAYDHAADRLDVSRAELNSDMLQFQATGKIKAASTERWLDAEGKLSYDLAKVQRALQPYLGASVQMAGTESRSFSVSGPLVAPTNVPPSQRTNAWAQQFTAKADAGWQWLNLYGFQIGRGELQAEMRSGVARVLPLELAVGEGRLRLAPEVRFASGSPELTLPPSRMIENVDLTPEMCNQGLHLAMPILAGAVQTRGKFSLQMDQCRLPLDNIKAGDMAGQVTVHSLEVTPGPLVQTLSSFLGRDATTRIANETQVPFRMVEGRVYHQGLEVTIGGVVVRTQGWVGLDQTLGLLAEMPIPASLLANSPLAASMQNQAIRVPIGGTLQRPAIDQRALAQTVAQMFRESTTNAAESALRDGLNRGLNQLFGPTPGVQK